MSQQWRQLLTSAMVKFFTSKTLLMYLNNPIKRNYITLYFFPVFENAKIIMLRYMLDVKRNGDIK